MTAAIAIGLWDCQTASSYGIEDFDLLSLFGLDILSIFPGLQATLPLQIVYSQYSRSAQGFSRKSTRGLNPRFFTPRNLHFKGNYGFLHERKRSAHPRKERVKYKEPTPSIIMGRQIPRSESFPGRAHCEPITS